MELSKIEPYLMLKNFIDIKLHAIMINNCFKKQLFVFLNSW